MQEEPQDRVHDRRQRIISTLAHGSSFGHMSEEMQFPDQENMGELVAEGSKLLEQLAEEDAAGISEAVARPISPVARALHEHLEQTSDGRQEGRSGVRDERPPSHRVSRSERLYDAERMYNKEASFASPGRQFTTERMYSSERAEVRREEDTMMEELVAEGSTLLGQLAEEDAARISEAVARPNSPVARALHGCLRADMSGGIGDGAVGSKERHVHFDVDEAEEGAVVKIQALARGKKERKRHAEWRARREEQGQKSEAERAAEEMAANEAFADLDKAAVKIQALARGKKERRRHVERRARREELERDGDVVLLPSSSDPVLSSALLRDDIEELRRVLLEDLRSEMAVLEKSAQDR